ncbi:MAG: MAPEG family protein [Archangium sp.]|nr:MAPEG family protein [Archangium sp.]
MLIPHVTLLYGGLVGLLILGLGLNVTRVRGQHGNWYESTPPPKPLYMAIRAHGNAIEWTPITVILILAIELAGGSSTWLHVLGGSMVAARVMHAVGMLTAVKLGVIGATLMYGVVGGAGGWALWIHFVK